MTKTEIQAEIIAKQFKMLNDYMNQEVKPEGKWANEWNELASLRQQLAECEEPKELAEISGERIKCDACGCHPSVIITTQFGTFCQEHARYV